jgi:cobalt-zinc-cadmium efflux system outer membrane protein
MISRIPGILIFNLYWLAVFTSPLSAQGIKEDVLTVEQALSAAFQNNPEVQEARKKVKMREVRYKQSRKLANPEVEVEADKIRKDFANEDEEDNVESNFTELEGGVKFNQPLELWGKRGLKIDIAKDEIIQAELEFRNIWLDIAKQIKEQYAQTLLEQKSIGLAEENLNIARRLLDQVQVRFNSGKARNHELVRAKLEAANARNNLLRSENNFRIALGTLNILMGRNIKEAVNLRDTLTVAEMRNTLENYLEIALSERADILSQQREIVKKGKELSLAKRKKLPDVMVGVFANREDEMYNAGAGLSFELPVWNQFQGDVQEVDLQKQTAEIHLDALKRSVELEVYEAFQNVNLAFQTVHNLEDSIKVANELLRIITIEYEEGEAPFLTYLEGVASYQKTKQEYLETLTDYSHKLADLEQSIGKTQEFTEEKKQ